MKTLTSSFKRANLSKIRHLFSGGKRYQNNAEKARFSLFRHGFQDQFHFQAFHLKKTALNSPLLQITFVPLS